MNDKHLNDPAWRDQHRLYYLPALRRLRAAIQAYDKERKLKSNISPDSPVAIEFEKAHQQWQEALNGLDMIKKLIQDA